MYLYLTKIKSNTSLLASDIIRAHTYKRGVKRWKNIFLVISIITGCGNSEKTESVAKKNPLENILTKEQLNEIQIDYSKFTPSNIDIAKQQIKQHIDGIDEANRNNDETIKKQSMAFNNSRVQQYKGELNTITNRAIQLKYLDGDKYLEETDATLFYKITNRLSSYKTSNDIYLDLSLLSVVRNSMVANGNLNTHNTTEMVQDWKYLNNLVQTFSGKNIDEKANYFIQSLRSGDENKLKYLSDLAENIILFSSMIDSQDGAARTHAILILFANNEDDKIIKLYKDWGILTNYGNLRYFIEKSIFSNAR